MFAYANGDKYDGQWKDGVKFGFGVYSYANKDRYEGAFEADNMHGNGVFIYANGDMANGRWENDQRYGRVSELWTANAILHIIFFMIFSSYFHSLRHVHRYFLPHCAPASGSDALP